MELYINLSQAKGRRGSDSVTGKGKERGGNSKKGKTATRAASTSRETGVGKSSLARASTNGFGNKTEGT